MYKNIAYEKDLFKKNKFHRITPLEMVSKIIKSSPLLLFVNHLVDWLEKIAPTRNYDSSRINFRESFGDNFSGFLNQRGVTDFNDPDIAFSTKAGRLSKKQLSNLNSIFH